MLRRFRLSAQGPSNFQPCWDWERMEADQGYFCRALTQLLEGNGYTVLNVRSLRDPFENQARVCVVVLQQRNRVFVALGLRWLMTVTSDVVSRFGRELASSRAAGAMIITTSLFTEAAVLAARRDSIELYDRNQLWRLIR